MKVDYRRLADVMEQIHPLHNTRRGVCYQGQQTTARPGDDPCLAGRTDRRAGRLGKRENHPPFYYGFDFAAFRGETLY